MMDTVTRVGPASGKFTKKFTNCDFVTQFMATFVNGQLLIERPCDPQCFALGTKMQDD